MAKFHRATKKTQKIITMEYGDVKMLCNEMDEALQPLAQKYGIEIKTAGGSYTSQNCKIKVQCSCIVAGTTITPQAQAFMDYANRYGMSSTDLHREFVSIRGERYKIIGLKPKSPKRPILAQCVHTGKNFVFSATEVVRYLTEQK